MKFRPCSLNIFFHYRTPDSLNTVSVLEYLFLALAEGSIVEYIFLLDIELITTSSTNKLSISGLILSKTPKDLDTEMDS